MIHPIIAPMMAQVGLTLVIMLLLFVRRIPAMAAAKPTNEQMQDKESLKLLPAPARFAAENYNHLFEAPVLFYAMCAGAAAAGITSELLVTFAWAYVALRVVHSLIHCTYNKVMHRFSVFALSSLVLIAMFVEIALSIWS